MATVSAAEFLKRYTQGVQNAGQTYQSGVQNSEDWASRYASPEAQQRMQAGLQAAIAEGKPAQGAQALGTTGWRNKTIAKAGNYTGAATVAATNIQPYVQTILAAGDAAKQASASVTGPKNRATAAAKATAAINAIMTTWNKP